MRCAGPPAASADAAVGTRAWSLNVRVRNLYVGRARSYQAACKTLEAVEPLPKRPFSLHSLSQHPLGDPLVDPVGDALLIVVSLTTITRVISALSPPLPPPKASSLHVPLR